jgi:hypothetical protein
MKTAEVVRIREGRMFGLALCVMACPLTTAADDMHRRPAAMTAPMEIPHAANMALDAKAAKKRAPRNLESSAFLDLTPGLKPLPFPKNSDVRARLLTPELHRTPVVGWIAANLYRDKKDTGWCLEVDPGEGEYLVFYRVHLK